MNQVRFFFCLIVILYFNIQPTFANNLQNKYLAFIDQYSELAIIEQQRHGIPASITMAQALLESSAGESRLAKQANNHFGIKCGGEWTGKTIFHDDDKRNDCFRKYASVLDSYEDHSIFLKRPRYAFLYEYQITDYKSWAKGLSRAGYATDPNYAKKLIELIERYELYNLDSKALETDNETFTKDDAAHEQSISPETQTVKPSDLYYDATNNGIQCVVLKEQATLTEVAKVLGRRLEQLLHLNDMTEDFELPAGSYVYLGVKKNSADNHQTHTVQKGESMHSIAQLYGIKLKKLYSLNKLTYGTPATIGVVLSLQ